MQSNPPPNLTNLNQLFNQYDQDHDGQVDKQQIQSILKDLGYTDVYIGTIKKVIRLINQRDGETNTQTLNFLQVEEYAEAMITKGNFKVWKTNLHLRSKIAEMIKQLYNNQEENGAAPGASPTETHGQKGPNHQQGQISINVGNLAQCPQYIRLLLEKQKGQQSAPFVRFVLQRNSNEQAKQLQASFKQLYNTLIQIMKVEQQTLIDQILSVNFDTIVQGNVFTLNISTQNQGLIELIEVFAESLDQLMNSQVNGKIEAEYRFDFDFEKFINDPSYNFYDMLVKNSMINLKWNVWDLFNGLRKIALKAKTFEELKWSPTDPFLLVLIGLLHCEKFIGRLEFQNTSTSNQQVESKKQIVNFFQQLREGLKESEGSMNLDFIKMIEHLEGKLFLEAGVKDWRFRFQAKVTGLSKVFVKEVKQIQDEENQQAHEIKQNFAQNSQQTENQTLNVTPPSSPKILKKQDSLKSLKKYKD